MRITRLEIENVLSIERASIDFSDSGLMLVEGWNYDDESANGAGKSSIFTAMSWGLFGNFPRNIGSSDIINSAAKKASCTVHIATSANLLRVIRKRPGSSEFFCNEAPAGADEFARLLGITYEQFMLVQYFAQGLGSRFLELNDSARKDFLLTLIKANGFADAKSIVDKSSKQIDLKIQKTKQEIESNEARKSAFSSMLISSNKLEKTISTTTANINETNKKILDLQKIEQPDISKLEDLESKLRGELESIAVAKGSLRSVRNRLDALQRQSPPQIEADGNCPQCSIPIDVVGRQFLAHNHLSSKAKLDEWTVSIETQRQELVAEINELDAKVVRESGLKNTLNKCLVKMSDLASEYRKAQGRIVELKHFVNQEQTSLSAALDAQARQDSLVHKINTSSTEIVTSTELLEQLNIELIVQDTASNILSPVGAPAYVMDEVVNIFNDRVANLIQHVWPAASYRLQSFKENKTGNTVAKFSDVLTIGGLTRSVGALSGGERRCLSLIIDLALLDTVVQYSGAKMSPIILDEPFDHLDASNRERAIELLRIASRDRQIVVVDHANETKGLFDKSLMVVKRNGCSTVSVIE